LSTSYKLITRDTVEEKILTLQNRKREIINAMIGSENQLADSLPGRNPRPALVIFLATDARSGVRQSAADSSS
jgi:hypothetical protein